MDTRLSSAAFRRRATQTWRKQPGRFFLHIPFPTPEIFNALPPAEELLEALCDYDLLGFQTDNDQMAFLDCVASKTRLTSHDDGSYSAWGKRFRTEVYPIGIEPDEIAADASGPLPPNWRS